MSTTATLLQLAAELTLFVVVVAGAGLSIRDGLLGLDRSARLLLGAGFVILAAVAFAVGSLTIVRTDLGREIEDCVLLTDVWVFDDDRWRVVRRHSTPVPAADCIST